MDTIRKDWLVLSSAMFLGAIFAHSLGYSIELGVLAGLLGGIFGYLFCLLTEPKRIILAAREAWRKTTKLRPLPDWKSRLAQGADFGLAFGGPMGIIIGTIVTVSEGETNAFEWLRSYIFWASVISLSSIIWGIIGEYAEENHSPIADDAKYARHLNIIALHLHAARLTLIAINYLFFGLVLLAMRVSENTPAVICGIPRFAKNFAILIHSEKATAFGVYGSIGATAIYFLVPYSPISMAIAAFIGGGIGVYARPFVLNWLQQERSTEAVP